MKSQKVKNSQILFIKGGNLLFVIAKLIDALGN